MTPNDLNRRVVADWLRGTSNGCELRAVMRSNFRITSGLESCITLVWHAFQQLDHPMHCFSFYGHSRAEATAKAAAWILRKGWEVTSG